MHSIAQQKYTLSIFATTLSNRKDYPNKMRFDKVIAILFKVAFFARQCITVVIVSRQDTSDLLHRVLETYVVIIWSKTSI